MEITRLQTELNRLFAGILENQRASLATATAWPERDVLEGPQEVQIVVEVPASRRATSRGRSGKPVAHRASSARPAPGKPNEIPLHGAFFGEFEKVVPLPARQREAGPGDALRGRS